MSASPAASSQGASLPPEAKRCRSAPEDDASACASAASTFTERCANDSVTLSLVLSCLDVYSIVRARRVCRTWQAATRAPLAWSHCILAVNAEHVARIPVSSVALLRHLTIVRNCTAASVYNYTQALFEWVGRLGGLRSLRLEGLMVSVQLCHMLSTCATGLRWLDLRLCRTDEATLTEEDQGYELTANLQAWYELKAHYTRHVQMMGPLDSSSASNGEHDAQDGLRSAVATSASRDVKDAMAHMRLPQVADEQPLPMLRLPQLTSLKLPNSSLFRTTLALIGSLPSVQTLHLHRSCHDIRSTDSAVGERHYLALMNRLFAHTYADTLKHLVLSNLHAHGFESYRFELLHNLTHLSLEHSNKGGGITCAALHAVAALPRLERCEIQLRFGAISVCVDPAWWQALATVPSLTSLALWSRTRTLDDGEAAAMLSGLQHLLGHNSNNNIRLEKLQIDLPRLVRTQQVLEMDFPHLHTLAANADVCMASIASLARMPRLTSLEMSGLQHDKQGHPQTPTLLHALPRLRVLNCVRACSGSDSDFWLALANMPALTSLAVQTSVPLSNDIVDMWCAIANDTASQRPDAMRAFMGGAPPDRGLAPRLALQHLRLNSDAITSDQCRRLLRSMPQLQLLSTYMTRLTEYKYVARPFCSRLLASVQRYEQRMIVEYTRQVGEMD